MRAFCCQFVALLVGLLLGCRISQPVQAAVGAASFTVVPVLPPTCLQPYIMRQTPTGAMYIGCSSGSSVTVLLVSDEVRTVTALATSTQCLTPGDAIVHPTTGVVYVSCQGSGIVAINGTSVTTLATTSQCAKPYGLAINTRPGGLLFLSCASGTGSWGGTVVAFASNGSATVLATATQCGQPNVLVYNATSQVLYASCATSGVVAINATGAISTIVSSVSCGATAALAFHATKGIMYVACKTASGNVWALKDGALTAVTTSNECTRPQKLWLHPTSDALYVACNSQSAGLASLVAVQGATITAVSTWEQCETIRAVVHPSTGVLYTVCNVGSDGDFVSAACPVGQYYSDYTTQTCTICAAGRFQYVTGQGSCFNCSAGTYNVLDAQVSPSACTLCPPGTQNAANGASSLSACQLCPVGTASGISGVGLCPACAPGTYQPGAGGLQCLTCPENTYQPLAGATSSSQCLPCPISAPSSPSGASALAQCTSPLCQPGNYTDIGAPPCSLLCPLGQYCTLGTLRNCPAGTHNPVLGRSSSSDCLPCPAGTASSSPGVSICIPCAPGFLQPQAGSLQCVPCPENTYQPLPGATSSDACQPCPISAPIAPGASSSSLQCTSPVCDPGNFTDLNSPPCSVPCPSGQYCTLGVVRPCPAGTAFSGRGGSHALVCRPCAPGSLAAAPGTADCQSCPPGFFQPLSGATQCKPCPAGTFQPLTGAASNSTCLPCPDTAPTSQIASSSSLQCTAPPCALGYYSVRGKPLCGVPCPAGHYCELGVAQACPAGTFNGGTGSSGVEDCLPCAPGTSSAAPGVATCLQCGAGYFQPANGSLQCLPCPANTYQVDTGAVSANQCLACPASTPHAPIASSSALQCSAPPCAPGNYTLSADATRPPCQVRCPGGSYCTLGLVRPCPASTYNPRDGMGSADDCLACPSGSASSTPGATRCPFCNPGFYQPASGASQCLPCPVNTFQPLEGASSSSACLPCPEATPSSQVASSSSLQCIAVACARGNYSVAGHAPCSVPCPAGYFCELGSARACPAGTFNERFGSGDSSACLSCAAGTASTATGVTACQACSAGYYQPHNGSLQCVPCPANTFQVQTGAASLAQCVPCPPSSPSSPPASSSSLQCSAPLCPPGNYTLSSNTDRAPCQILCPVGSFCTLGIVRPCAVGTFNALEGRSSSHDCLACPSGAASSTPGASSCPLCAAGFYQPAEGSLQCRACPSNTFQPRAGATTLAECLPCPRLTPNSQPASSSSLQCSAPPCALGTYTAVADPDSPPCNASCPMGQYCILGVPHACPAGTFNNATGRGDRADCQPCPPGTTAAASGAASCLPCPPGFYQSATGALQCVACPRNTFQPFPGAGSVGACQACPAGAPTSQPASSSSLQCSSLPCPPGNYTAASDALAPPCGVPCPPGQYCTTGVLHLCPAGTFNPLTGQGSIDSCRPCAAGTSSSVLGATNCFPCPAGFYQDASRALQCRECPSDTYQPVPGAAALARCLSCPRAAPNSQPASSSVLQCSAAVCPPGNYTTSADPDQAPCDAPCPLGHYCTLGVARPCPAGTYNDRVGASSSDACLPCAPGTASASSGAETCARCSPGYFQAAASATQCAPCAAGTFAAAPGTTRCAPCPTAAPNSPPASTAESQCVVPMCAPGFWSDPSVASTSLCSTACPTGHACLAGSRSRCAAGTFSERTGSASCTPCGAGQYSVVEGSASSADCQACPTGTYSHNTVSASCLPCPALLTTSSVGAASVAACLAIEACQDTRTTLCPLGAPQPIAFSLLLADPSALSARSQANTSASTLATASFYGPVGTRSSLRSQVFTQQDGASQAEANSAPSSPASTSTGTATASTSIVDAPWFAIASLIAVAFLPWLFYRRVPARVAAYADRFSTMHKPSIGETFRVYPTQFGAVVSWSFVCISAVLALLLLGVPNTITTDAILPTFSSSLTGTAHADIAVTFRAFSTSAADSPLSCPSSAATSATSATSATAATAATPAAGGYQLASQSGFSTLFVSRTHPSANVSCSLALDCIGCGLAARTATMQLDFPFDTQLIEWEVSIPDSSASGPRRLYGILQQQQGQLLDAHSELQFAIMESYRVDERESDPSRRVRSGFGVDYQGYVTRATQPAETYNRQARVQVDLVFQAADVIFQQTVTSKLSPLQLVSMVGSAVASLFAAFGVAFAVLEGTALRKWLRWSSGEVKKRASDSHLYISIDIPQGDATCDADKDADHQRPPPEERYGASNHRSKVTPLSSPSANPDSTCSPIRSASSFLQLAPLSLPWPRTPAPPTAAGPGLPGSFDG
jgi:hypothetical protein